MVTSGEGDTLFKFSATIQSPSKEINARSRPIRCLLLPRFGQSSKMGTVTTGFVARLANGPFLTFES